MVDWRHLQVTEETEPVNPNNGLPYVLYNQNINKVWIFMGVKWILEQGVWEDEKTWGNCGIWHFYNENY